MITSIAITDPTTALMLSHLAGGNDGRVSTPLRGGRRRRWFHQHASLLKRLA